MKNLLAYTDNCFEVHTKAVKKMHKGQMKLDLVALSPIILEDYNAYEAKFNQNKLSKLSPNPKVAESKNSLLKLYKYQSSTIISVRNKILESQIRTIINTCQNCTLDSVNSLDHILPKSKFPEFVVNPKNLFPCCTTCNSYKLDSIEKNGEIHFLNLYLDLLPDEQYLFVNIFKDDLGELNFNYFLENIDSKIDLRFFEKIQNHYSKLHLFERMRLKSIEHISEMENKINSFLAILNLEDILITLTGSIIEDKKAYGNNHWKCILESTLINSSLFLERFKKETKCLT